MSRAQRLFHELKRRRVYRVAVVYSAVAFVIWQVAEIAIPALGMPDWVLTLVVVLTLVGLPIALVLGWAFDITAEGVRRTEAANDEGGETTSSVVHPFRITVAAVGIVIVAAAWFVWSRVPAAESNLTSNRIAVFPFVVHGDDELMYLREGIAHLLSGALDGAGDLRTVDPHALLGTVSGSTGPDPQTAQEIAARFGAELYVLGSVVGSPGDMAVNAALYDVTRGERTTAEAVEGQEGELQTIIDELARRLVVDLAGSPGDRLVRTAALTTQSVPALKAYLAGHSALSRGDFSTANEAFQDALKLDGAFVLARYQLAVSMAWEGHGQLSRQAVAQAARDRASLPAREQRLLLALDAFLRGDLDGAEDAYRAYLGEYPDDVEANYMLAESIFHLGPIHGRSMQRSREPFERVLSFDHDNIFTLHHLAVLAIKRAELTKADSLLYRALATEPASWLAVDIRVMQALASGDPDMRAQVQGELQSVETLGLHGAMMAGTSFYQSPAEARWIVDALTAQQRPTQVRATGHTMLAYLEVASGQWSQAERSLNEADRLYRIGPSHRAVFALIPFAPYDRSVLQERLREVEAWDVASLPPSEFVMLLPPVEVQSAIRLYLLGALNARLGHDSAAFAYAERLEKVNWTFGGNLSATLAPGIRAAVAAAHGEVEEALRSLETALFDGHYDEVYASPVVSMAAERYLMAELLLAVGRAQEALPWFASLGDLQRHEIAYLAPAHFRRAQIYERLGELDEARKHYARFAELWQDCDPELRPFVDEAEQRLQQLRNQPD
jgi:tetratricopeptide (TPR) repeat protein